jgi:formate hydrogenlyase subunit 4
VKERINEHNGMTRKEHCKFQRRKNWITRQQILSLKKFFGQTHAYSPRNWLYSLSVQMNTGQPPLSSMPVVLTPFVPKRRTKVEI